MAAFAVHQSRRVVRRLSREATRLLRRSVKQARARRSDVRVAAAQARDRLADARGSVVRLQKRARRFRELQIDPFLHQRGIERQLASLARGSDPIIVGPWLSEVGYEVLYWVPFLRWFVDRYGVRPERVIALSRGGVGSWYAGIAGHYVEMLDLMDAREFARRNEERRKAGDQKQLREDPLDVELANLARQRIGARSARVCHPSLMFQLFRPFWFGNRTLDFFLHHTRFESGAAGDAPGANGAPTPGLPLALDLPTPYVAVKFYTGAALPDTPAHREALRTIVRGAARRGTVVNLDTGLAFDEHEDYLFQDVPNVVSLRSVVTPRDNLAVQTAVIAGASLYVGTCGSLAWLAPMLGTPTVGVFADDRFLRPHLYVAPYVYRKMGAATFSTVDLNGARELLGQPRLAVPDTSTETRRRRATNLNDTP